MNYDVIVIGAGHAGCEAGLAAARMGASCLLLTMNLDTVGKMSCNPAIGGIAKGHLVREIDALGGEMGKVCEVADIHSRMLNLSRGPAVWAPRAQCDRVVYQFEMKYRIEETPGLELKQGMIESLVVEGDQVKGVMTAAGIFYAGKTIIVSSGTFMRGLLHMGDKNQEGGRAGDRPAKGISASLENLGFKLGRLKTGTPPRLHMRSIDLSKTEEQPGEKGVRFSFDEHEFDSLPKRSCYITYTTAETKRIIEENIHRSPMYSGKIQGVGPRYCPSIEDKVVRFADKERHQIFLEPEGIKTQEVYANGISSSLPYEVQLAFIRSITGLENAEMMRPAYAVEYDYVESGQLQLSLETKSIEGLFLAGQVNGTSGYEEAAAQGLMAGINAALKVANKPPFILKRSEAYIAVMIDDLINKGVDEPYRMFTSRAEHRLLLRQDNADLRLRHYGYTLGLITDKQKKRLDEKKKIIAEETTRLPKMFRQIDGKGYSLAQLLCRPEISYLDLDLPDYGPDINQQIELAVKYAGYVKRQQQEVDRLEHTEKIKIPADFSYDIKALRVEAQEKLSRILPENVGQASRIPGISPADLSVLMVALK